MQTCAAGSILIASFPIARTDLRAKWISISVAYLKILVSFALYHRVKGKLLGQLCQYFVNIRFCREHEDQFQLRNFHIDRIIIFAEKDADIIAEDLRATL